MTIGMAALIGLFILCIVGALMAALYGLITLLEDHPIILGVLLVLLLWALVTATIYAKG